MRAKILLGLIFTVLGSTAQATLIDRGDGLIYDDLLDITWLQDASLGGIMNWDDSVAWADGLIFEGFDDWRLPSIDELASMYDTLGGAGSLTGNQGLIQNIQSVHWSGTEYAPNPLSAWFFRFGFGLQNLGGKPSNGAAWAVRPGDVVAAVPEPGTLVLLGLGLVGFGLSRIQRAART